MTEIRIELERSGGFAGLSLPPMALTTADLEPQEAQQLGELVDVAERAPARAPRDPRRGAPDAMQYDLTIMREGQVRRLSFDDTTIPPGVEPLLDRLLSQGRSLPRRD